MIDDGEGRDGIEFEWCVFGWLGKIGGLRLMGEDMGRGRTDQVVEWEHVYLPINMMGQMVMG